MHEIRITRHGTFGLSQTVQLTDEEWENAVDPETGRVYDLEIIEDKAHKAGEGGTLCAQCSGFGRKFNLSLDDDLKVTEITNASSDEVIYSDDRR